MGNTEGSRLDELFWPYVAGFLDGDGCIAIKFERSKTCALGYRARVRVSFTQHKARRKVLDFLHSRIGSGVISQYQHNNMAEYVIRDQKVIATLLQNIEPYVVIKAEHLQLAKQLLILKEDGYNEESLEKMKSLFEQIGSLNNYPKSFKFDPVTT